MPGLLPEESLLESRLMALCHLYFSFHHVISLHETFVRLSGETFEQFWGSATG
jgi:hypothetical protein